MYTPQKVLHLDKALALKKFSLSAKYLATVKEDGWMVILEKIEGVWRPPKSSSGREIPSLAWLTPWLYNLLPGIANCMVVAEAHNRDIPFHIMNGMLNRKNESCTDVRLTVHDFITPDNFQAYLRWEDAQEFVTDAQRRHSCFQLAEKLGEPNSLAGFTKCFNLAREQGFEGAVFKSWYGLYSPGKRNVDLIKMKEEVELDLLVVDRVDGVGEKGEPSIVLTVKRSSGLVFPVNLPAKKYGHIDMMGKVVTVVAMKELPNGMLREPRFKCIRFDKNPTEID